MESVQLYDDGVRSWVFFGRDAGRPGEVIDTNEYLVTHQGRGLLLDPGGPEIFPPVVAALSREILLEDIEAVFGSHQDPDIISSIPLWNTLCQGVKAYVPQIWAGFLAHFAVDVDIVPIPDEGMTIPLGGSSDLRLVPAHYVHSSASYSLYDERAKILFSGDVGAALLPEGSPPFVEDFDAHVGYMEGFHRRWLPSNEAKNVWVERVRQLDVELMCPQHGAIFRRHDVPRFLDWLEGLEVAAALPRA
ncbi:MAG: FprA family A-type flavoprotein [Acidimicrobiia bacterium]|nr:FprA family A-type flavoprotein [Acidimicrobiia bacterium]